MIDWQTEAKKRTEELFTDLFTMLHIDSERDVEHSTTEFPLGEGPAIALRQMLSLAERDGFKTKNVENVAGRIEFGAGDETLGILAHVDEVPAGSGWDTDPFEPQVIDGKLYARGSADDKGPMMAAYYALKIIKELNLPVSKQVHFILGTDEESEWAGITRYLEVEPTPDFGFSPDAEFPIINGEKGIASFLIEFKPELTTNGEIRLLKFDSGLRDNMIPQTATAIIEGYELDNLSTEFVAFAAENGLVADAQVEDHQYILELTGKGAHALEPRAGVNAATYLATFLNGLDLDLAGKQYVQVIADHFHLDSRGAHLGIKTTDDLMGELTASPDIFHYRVGEISDIVVNVRFPQGIAAEQITKLMEQAINHANVSSKIFGRVETPHYVSADDPLVKTLLSVYERQTGNKGKEQVIGGGTYGRILPRGVAFGAQFPGRENVMHQANEYMPVDDIIAATAIYAEAVYELIK
ncbi:dipeptidase PepV [Lapidilactobacillus mulanensis]|uniref:Dipeptidase PepV n=1 Tax=Lapidilactobacillus mulanensis TaxID=2485999 RepID=A0ABW4DR82_9LACO|nr:dipeptidase PepV [Lapidilactobacillus mulanensis]